MTTVFIWNNNTVSYRMAKTVGYAPASKRISGHCAVNIDDHFVPVVDAAGDYDTFTDNKKSYVSWIPSYMKRGHETEESHHDGIVGVGNRNFFADLCMETYAPDHIIRIPTPSKAHVERMRKEWEGHLQPKNGRGQTYDYKRKNCSRVVARVLRAGWNKGGGNIRYGQLVSGLWTPLMVKRLALDLKGGPAGRVAPIVLTWDGFVSELVANGVISPTTGYQMRFFKKRATNRGSSMADGRFTVEGSWKRFLRGGWDMVKSEENMPAEAFIYMHLVDNDFSRAFAKVVLTDAVNAIRGLPAEGFNDKLIDKIVQNVERRGFIQKTKPIPRVQKNRW